MDKFHGMTRFTIADFNKGFWMVELDPESRKYTMMALDIGKFQWTLSHIQISNTLWYLLGVLVKLFIAVLVLYSK